MSVTIKLVQGEVVSVHVTKAYRVNRYTASLLVKGTWLRWIVSFTPWPLYPWVENFGTRWIKGWVGPRFGLDLLGKRKISCRSPESNPRSPSSYTSYYTDCVIPAFCPLLSTYKIFPCMTRRVTNHAMFVIQFLDMKFLATKFLKPW
jgi:hypothetical protein